MRGVSETVPSRRRPVGLTIAGFDPSSGAGTTADLKVFAAHGLYGMSCLTALTVQSTQGVERVEAVSPILITETLKCLDRDVEFAGIKIGMLAQASGVKAVAAWLGRYLEQHGPIPVVLDPVLRSSSRKDLLAPDALASLGSDLLPLVTILTPNLEEAFLLSGNMQSKNLHEDAVRAARSLLRQMHRPGASVVVTGGHFSPEQTPDDLLLKGFNAEEQWFRGTWVRTRATHGTGCAFSSALLCGLVRGLPVAAAVAAAKSYVHAALEAAYPVGQGRGPMHHLYAFSKESKESLESSRVPKPACEP